MYYAVLVTGAIFSILNKRKLAVVFTLLLTALAFLRYGVGTDYFSYEFLYNRLQDSVFNEMRYGIDLNEIGFRGIGSLLKSIGLIYQQYLIFFATANMFFVYKTCKEYSKNPALSMFLYFCLYYLIWTFSGIRQGVTIAIGVYYLLEVIKKNKPLKFIIVVLLLSLIHASALFLLILYCVSKLKISKNQLLIFTIFCLIVSILPIGVMISKMTWIPFYQKINWYTNAELSINLFDFQSLGRIGFLTIAFYFYNLCAREGEFMMKVTNVYIVGLSMYFIFQFSELTAARLSIYAQYLNIIILANILYFYKTTITKTLYLYCLFIFCFLFLFKNAISMEKNFERINYVNTKITPYVNIFTKDDYIFSSKYYISN
ncbi:MAG TPA: EpsG family protein [Clostridiales bacterium]|nr:EpsG family protein [Clostridiales bacterium]